MDLGIGMDSLMNPNEWATSSELFGQGSGENNGNNGNGQGDNNGGAEGAQNQGNQQQQNADNNDGNQDQNVVDNGISTTEVVDTSSNLFGGQSSESVGSGDNSGNGGPSNQNGGSSSTQTNVISSFAKAMREDGYLQNLTDEDFAGIKDAHSMAEAIKKEVQAQLTEEQRRVAQALAGGVSADEISQYNNAINALNQFTDDQIVADTNEAKNIRLNLIYRDYLNKGISEEQAKQLTLRSAEVGADKEDAKKALASNKAYFQQKYNDLLKQVEDSQKAEADKIEQQSKELKSILLNKEEVFDGFKVDAQTRQKAYDAVTKPVFQTKDGRQLTAIQKFEYENPVEFRKAIGLYFVLTNEFKGIGNLLNKEVRKQVTSHLSNFEERLNQRPRGGNPVYMEGDRGGGYNSESLLDGGWLLDTGK
jgi:hypothetical protein